MSSLRARIHRTRWGCWSPIACSSAVLLVTTLSCLERRDEASIDADNACTACHGDPQRAGDRVQRSAPPYDLFGASDESFPGVGAHAIHLNASDTHAPIACDECHVVPERTEDPGHADSERPAELRFGSLATRHDRSPTYDSRTRTCADSYCHGEARAVWTSPRTSTDACGSCHGLPPPPPHPPLSQCGICHAEVVDSENHFVVPALHVDGVVQVGRSECTQCHGSGEDPAPPLDTSGNEGTEAIGVGAHRAHLAPSGSSRPVRCEECHQVPEGVDEALHPNGLPAEVRLMGVAQTHNRDASWNRDSATCAETWCHGPTVAQSSPRWTEQTALSCGACHGTPPPAPHPQSEQCDTCHGEVIDASGEIVAPQLHVDGIVQHADGACSSCHGSESSPAPPPDVNGNSDPAALGVGAHQAHLSGGAASRALACDECHVVPETAAAAGHIDAPPAEVLLMRVARTGGRSPEWDRTTTTCTDTWCHGPSEPAPSPSWIALGPLSCASCHGMPPGPPHPQMTDCARCHGAVVGSTNDRIVDPSRHIDGIVDVELDSSCTACHGASDPAPPPDVAGNTSTRAPGVGAHRTHVDGTQSSRAVPCQTCHVVPDSVLAPGHVDSARPAEVQFSGVALAFGATPSYLNGSCESTPCHGAVFPRGHDSGGTHTEPIWTEVGGTQTECGSCHALPPGRPHPVADLNPVCSACHENIADDNRTFLRPDLHVDGNVTFEVP